MSVLRRNNANQGGFSLIEVLIAVLILAIGLLGVAGVQFFSMQRAMDANLRSLATLHAQSATDTILVAGALDEDEAKAALIRELGAGADVSVENNGDQWTVTITWTTPEGDGDEVVMQFRRP